MDAVIHQIIDSDKMLFEMVLIAHQRFLQGSNMAPSGSITAGQASVMVV